jgi:hypothetical protein
MKAMDMNTHCFFFIERKKTQKLESIIELVVCLMISFIERQK